MGKRRISTLIAGAACAGVATLAGCSVYADTTGSAQQRIGSDLATGSVSITTSGDVAINVIPTSAGSLGVGKGTVTVTSSTGYQLYISGTDAGGNGYTSLNYNGNPEAGSRLAGLAVTTPTAFSSATNNSWGYAVGSEYASGFSAASVYEAAKNAGNITDSTTISSLKWKGVSRKYDKIRTTTNASAKTTDVYFGVYAGTGAMSGNYQNSVVYTAFVEGADKLDITPRLLKNNDTVTVTAEYKSGELPITNKNQINFVMKDGASTIATCDNINITSNGNSNLLSFTCTVHTTWLTEDFTPYNAELNLTIPGRSDTLSFQSNGSYQFGIYMQNLADVRAKGNSAGVGVPFAAMDSRTNKVYRLTKLADGKYWMTQNLWLQAGQLIKTANDKDFQLPASSTNNNDWRYASDSSATNGGDSTPKMKEGTHTNNTVDTKTTNTGSWFNWLAATAGTGNSYGETTLNSPVEGNAAQASDSVCPQGWHLPTGGSSGELNTLYTNASYNSYANFKADNAWAVNTASTNLQGDCGSSACPNSAGSLGRWWSSTQNDSNYAYNLVASTSSFLPTNYSYKYFGYSVRCVLSAS